MQPTHLDLFSGIGGFSLAARWAGFETVGFCEVDNYCQNVLRRHWPDVPIHKDINNLDGHDYESVDLITGGYPCQPFSVAGARKGTTDHRHLWPEMLRVIAQARPAFVLAENVTGHITLGLDKVLADLESQGYAARPIIIPACGVNAPHRRYRVWVIAHSDSQRRGAKQISELGGETQSMANAECVGQLQPKGCQQKQRGWIGHCSEDALNRWWTAEPGVGRVADGVPHRVDRLKGLGNAIVPQIAYQILKPIFDLIADDNG